MPKLKFDTLKLDAANPNGPTNPGVETRARVLRQNIQSLEILPPAALCRQLHATLVLINQQPLADKSRLAVLDLHYDALMPLFDALSATQLRPFPPTPEPTQSAPSIFHAALKELGRGYKWLLLQAVQATCTLYGKKALLHRVLFRAMATQCSAILHQLKAYRPPVSAELAELYRLYDLACRLELSEQAVDSFGTLYSTKLSISALFKATMLLLAVDPFHLSPGQHDQVMHKALELQHLLFLAEPDPKENPTAVFVIDLAQDRWPEAWSQSLPVTLQPVYLHVLRFVQSLEIRLAHMHLSYSPAHTEKKMLLRTLLARFRPSPRQSERYTNLQTLEIVTGLDAVWLALAGRLDGHTLPASRSPKIRGQVINASSQGGRVQVTTERPWGCDVGALLACYWSDPLSGQSTWRAGRINWLKENHAQQFEMGIEFFDPGLTAVWVSDDLGATPRRHLALYHAPDLSRFLPPSLWLHAWGYSAGQQVTLHTSTRHKQVTLVDLRLLSSDHQLFQILPQD